MRIHRSISDQKQYEPAAVRTGNFVPQGVQHNSFSNTEPRTSAIWAFQPSLSPEQRADIRENFRLALMATIPCVGFFIIMDSDDSISRLGNLFREFLAWYAAGCSIGIGLPLAFIVIPVCLAIVCISETLGRVQLPKLTSNLPS